MIFGAAPLGSIELGGTFGSTITPPVPAGKLVGGIFRASVPQCAVSNITSGDGLKQGSGFPSSIPQ